MENKESESYERFGKVRQFFSGKRFQDSKWSWVVCISAAIINAINLGFTLSFGVVFPELMEYFGETRERTAWVGSISLGMTWFASPLAGYLCDRFGCRITAVLGGLLCITGLAFTSFAWNLSVMYVTYSVVYGLGTCLIYNPCFLVIATYFKNKLPIATGIVSLGGSIGVLVNGPLLQVLLDAFGWRGTFRIMVALFFVVCILSITFNPNVEETTMVETFETAPNKNEKEEDNLRGISLYCSVWTFPAYTVIVISLTVASFGLYIPYMTLVKHCEELGISAQKASQLFIFIGLASAVARVITGRLCNDRRVNPVFIYQTSLLIAGISALVLPLALNYWRLVIFSAIYGLCDGMFMTTQNFMLLTCVDTKRRTASFCINNVLYSFSAAAGGPVAGLIADKTGNYVISFYMVGGVLLLAFAIPTALIFINRGKSKVHPQKQEKQEESLSEITVDEGVEKIRYEVEFGGKKTSDGSQPRMRTSSFMSPS